MKINKNYQYKRKGLSLIELLLVISLAAVIITGALFTYNRISDTNKITEEIVKVNSLVSDSKVFALSSRYNKLNTALLRKLNVIDINDLTSKGQLKSGLSDGILIETLYNNQDKTITHIKLSFFNFNGEYCSKFIQGIEKQVDLITVEKRILKNHFDKNNFQEYDLAFTASSCDSLSRDYGTFPLILILPYS